MMESWQATWQALSAHVGLSPVVAAAVVITLVVGIAALLLWWRVRRRRAAAVGAPAVAPSGTDREARGPLSHGLLRTRSGVLQRILPLLGRERLDASSVAELEAALLGADVGVRMTERLVRSLERSSSHGASVRDRLAQEVLAILEAPSQKAPSGEAASAKPRVIMMVGVNGVGKTTTIGKLAARFQGEGKRVLLVAGDTFRAAAIEQLAIWAERTGADLVRQQHGGDPGAVVYDGLRAAAARGVDVVIVDTAGRLHTKTNLMEELRKIRRVAAREIPGAPHETLLVIDAVTGQNGIAQARAFLEHIDVSGVVLTKLDGTAKGGVVVAIAGEIGIPIRYVGVGEGVGDLREFDAGEFAAALLAPPEPSGIS